MASINYQTLRPEQAFQIYQNYMNEDKLQDALGILYRYITTFGMRRRAGAYQDPNEISVANNIQVLYKLMVAYVDLRLQIGVTLVDDQNQLKEMLKSFRQMTQHNHPEAFYEILEEYRGKVEKLFEEKAKAYSLQELQTLPFVGQMQYEEPAEELLFLSFDPQAKSSKDLQKSCLRLIWEAYRTIMENVKWNERMEELYFDTIKRVSAFCLKYRRRGEYQWFCEQINKFVLDLNVRDVDLKRNPSHVDLSRVTTNDKHVIARFQVVQTALDLDLHQEAFKTLETIFVLKTMRKGAFRESYLLQYYEFLSIIFAKSQNSLYQAFAYYNHFLAYRKKPVETPAEIQIKNQEINKKLNFLVLTVLTIPLYQQHTYQGDRIVQLFGQGTKVPNRDEMLRIIGEMNAIHFVTPVVKKIYNLLQNKQDILTISDQAKSIFDELKNTQPQFVKYVPLLEENLICSVLKNVSQIYKSIKLETLQQLLKFIHQDRIVQNLLYLIPQRLIDCKIDFLNQIVSFNQETKHNYNVQLLPNVLAKFVVENKIINPLEAAKKQLDSAELDMTTRSQIIKKLNKQADPNQIKKESQEQSRLRKLELDKQRQIEEQERQLKQKAIQEMEQKKAKELQIRQKLLSDIIKLKGNKFVTFEIHGERKKIELLKDHHLLDIDTNFLQDIKKKFEEDSKKGADDKFMKNFKKTDYIERERAKIERLIIETWQDNDLDQLQAAHKERFEKNLKLKELFIQNEKLFDQYFEKIKVKSEEQYNQQYQDWLQQLRDKYRELIISKAEELYKKAQELEKQQKEKRLAEQASNPQPAPVQNRGFVRGVDVAKAEIREDVKQTEPSTQPSVQEGGFKRGIALEKTAPPPQAQHAPSTGQLFNRGAALQQQPQQAAPQAQPQTGMFTRSDNKLIQSQQPPAVKKPEPEPEKPKQVPSFQRGTQVKK